jgi:hypothetical protein
LNFEFWILNFECSWRGRGRGGSEQWSVSSEQRRRIGRGRGRGRRGTFVASVYDRRVNEMWFTAGEEEEGEKFWILNFGFWIAQQHSSLASTVIDRRYKAFHSTFKIQHSKFNIAPLSWRYASQGFAGFFKVR